MNTFNFLFASTLLTLSAGAPSENGFTESAVIGKPSNQSCRSYSFNECDFAVDTLKTTFLGVEDSYCQTLCIAYGPECKYFVYDYPLKQCDIYVTQLDRFGKYCQVHGGPSAPVIAECEDYDGECKVNIKNNIFNFAKLKMAISFTELQVCQLQLQGQPYQDSFYCCQRGHLSNAVS